MLGLGSNGIIVGSLKASMHVTKCQLQNIPVEYFILIFTILFEQFF